MEPEPTPVEPTPVDPKPVDPTPVTPVDPTIDIDDPNTPLIGGAAWALLNLLSAVLTAVLALVLVLSKSHKDDDEDENEETQNTNVNSAEEDEEVAQLERKKIWKILSVITAAISIVLFFFTEDMSLPMVMIDKWTILMVVILVVNAVFFFLGRKWHEVEDEDEEVEAQ